MWGVSGIVLHAEFRKRTVVAREEPSAEAKNLIKLWWLGRVLHTESPWTLLCLQRSLGHLLFLWLIYMAGLVDERMGRKLWPIQNSMLGPKSSHYLDFGPLLRTCGEKTCWTCAVSIGGYTYKQTKVQHSIWLTGNFLTNNGEPSKIWQNKLTAYEMCENSRNLNFERVDDVDTIFLNSNCWLLRHYFYFSSSV